MKRKIIHLSDLHVGYAEQDLSARFQKILSNIAHRCQPSSNYVILITGDLVELATDEVSHLEVRKHLKEIEEAGFRVLVVPGNHDYGTGNLGYKKYVSIFKEIFFNDPEIKYPKLDLFDEIAFIGLDSTAEELHWYDRLFSEGELGQMQLEGLDKILTMSSVVACQKRVVYLHHHPFDPWPLHELKDSDRLGHVLLKHNNVDALLYGHNHRGKKHEKWGIARCYDAGSSTRKNNVLSVHRVIDLFQDPCFDRDEDFL